MQGTQTSVFAKRDFYIKGLHTLYLCVLIPSEIFLITLMPVQHFLIEFNAYVTSQLMDSDSLHSDEPPSVSRSKSESRMTYTEHYSLISSA
jgi:hypothetical protein